MALTISKEAVQLYGWEAVTDDEGITADIYTTWRYPVAGGWEYTTMLSIEDLELPGAGITFEPDLTAGFEAYATGASITLTGDWPETS